MNKLGVYKIPTYAVTALEYGDDSGLDKEDIANIRQWLIREFSDYGSLCFDWNNGINEEETGEVNEASFTSNPAFGLPMDCIDCTIYEVPYRTI